MIEKHYEPTLQELEAHLLQSINMSINSDPNDTSYNLSFGVKAKPDGLFFVFYSPSSMVMSKDLYDRLTTIIATNAYPYMTVFPQPAPLLVSWDVNNVHKARAWKFPWRRGISSRLEINNLSQFLSNNARNGRVWLMPNYSIDINHMTSVAVMGQSGSGKTKSLEYLAYNFIQMGEVLIIDPKASKDLVWFGRKHNQKVIYPTSETSRSDYLATVNDELSKVRAKMLHRQHQYLASEGEKSNVPKHLFVIIDELGSLTLGASRSVVNAFFSLLQTISLMGRETNIHLVLCSQTLSNQVLPTQVRDQTNVRILLGTVNSRSAQYLFPDIDTSAIVVPAGVGTGVVQTINGREATVTPLLMPTFKEV